MKHLYINSRLHGICVSRDLAPNEFRFTEGEPWLLLTPRRLRRLALLLGLRDPRVARLVALARRHAAQPERFFRPLGLDAPPDDPWAECPECGHLHTPHPVDAGVPCPECVEARRRAVLAAPTPRTLADREADRAARAALRDSDPEMFDDGRLSPRWWVNRHRRLERDWEEAARRIALGLGYRRVARELGCSVGLVHKRVIERRHWEDN